MGDTILPRIVYAPTLEGALKYALQEWDHPDAADDVVCIKRKLSVCVLQLRCAALAHPLPCMHPLLCLTGLFVVSCEQRFVRVRFDCHHDSHRGFFKSMRDSLAACIPWTSSFLPTTRKCACHA